MTKKHSVFVILLTNKNVDRLIGRLLNDHITVKTLGSGELYKKNKNCIGICLSLEISLCDDHKWSVLEKDSITTASPIKKGISKIMENLAMQCFSLIVIEGSPGASWQGSNVQLSKTKEKSTGSPFRDPGA